MLEITGDGRLSAFDRQIWNLTYECLRRFGCPVIFRINGPDVRFEIDRLICFFVPHDHPQARDVMLFLRNELKDHLRSAARQAFGGEVTYLPGTYVEVHTFSGLEGYLDREIVDQMAEDFTQQLLARLKNKLASPDD